MKKLLVGISNNVSQNEKKIKRWYNSFKKNCEEGSVVLLAANTTPDDITILNQLEIPFYNVSIHDTWYINNERLNVTAEYLKQSDADIVLVTDVFDVLFQGDPFEKLDTNTYDIFVSGEGVLVKEEPWNSDVLNKIFPTEFQNCLNQEVVNSGVIAGKRESVSELLSKMYELCNAGSNLHNVKDQSALIVMISNNKISKLKILNLDDSWAVHCAVAGPTQFFESWGFKNRIKYGIPYLNGDSIYSKEGKKYDIVHQFNRIPYWDQAITKSYV